jgi:DNA repair photolyase
VLEAAARHGAKRAGYMPLRLPGEVAALFEEWLREHRPLAAARVLGLIRGMRGGRLNDPRFGHRMRGGGPYAAMLAARFAAACRRLGLDSGRAAALDVTAFRRDPRAPSQADLFA